MVLSAESTPDVLRRVIVSPAQSLSTCTSKCALLGSCAGYCNPRHSFRSESTRCVQNQTVSSQLSQLPVSRSFTMVALKSRVRILRARTQSPRRIRSSHITGVVTGTCDSRPRTWSEGCNFLSHACCLSFKRRRRRDTAQRGRCWTWTIQGCRQTSGTDQQGRETRLYFGRASRQRELPQRLFCNTLLDPVCDRVGDAELRKPWGTRLACHCLRLQASHADATRAQEEYHGMFLDTYDWENTKSLPPLCAVLHYLVILLG